MAAGVAVARLQARFDGLVGSVRAVGTAAVLVVGVLRVATVRSAPASCWCSRATRARRTGRCAASPARRRRSPPRWRAPTGSRSCSRPTRCSRTAPARTAARVPRGEIAFERRVVRLRRGAPGARRRVAADRGRRADRADGSVGSREVDARRADRALPRPGAGPRAARRARRPRLLARMAARAGGDRAPGHDPVQRHGARQHRVRRRGDARGGRRGGAGRRRARVHRRSAGRLRHRAGPAGRGALGRPAAADRRRAHAAARSPDPAAGRADDRARRRQRDGGAGRPRGADGRPHDGADHPLARAWPGRPRASSSSTAAGSRRRTHARARPSRCCRWSGCSTATRCTRRCRGRSATRPRSTTWPSSRVVYKPRDTLAVHYRAVVAGAQHDVVATSIAGVDLAARAAKPRLRRARAPRRRALARGGAGVVRRSARRARHVAAVRPEAARAGRGRAGAGAPRRRPRGVRRAGADRLQAARAGGAARRRVRAEGVRAHARVRRRADRPDDRLAREGRCRRRGSRAPCRSCG